MPGSMWLPKAMVFNIKSSYRVNDWLPRETAAQSLVAPQGERRLLHISVHRQSLVYLLLILPKVKQDEEGYACVIFCVYRGCYQVCAA